MNASTATADGAFGHRVKLLVLGALVACMGVFALAGQAKADPASMNLTNGQLNLGFAFKGAEILPAPPSVQLDPPPAPATPLPDLWDARDTTDTTNPTAALPAGCLTPALLNLTTNPPTPVGPNPEAPCNGNPAFATVSGDLTGGAVTIPGSPDGGLGAVPGTDPPTSWGLPSGFRFPIMVVPNPLDGSPVPVSLASTGDLTGTYDSGTGALTLNGPIEARVLVGLATNPLGEYCALPLDGLTLSTTSNDDFPGVPFTSGFDGEGALTGTYNITEDATSVGGADCGTVNSVSKGLGSVWLSNGIAEPPVCPENTTGIPPNCVPDACPAGQIGTPPNCVAAKANIRIVKFQGPSKVRRFRSVRYRIGIRNTGNITANGVRIQIRGKRLFANFPVGQIGKNRTRTVNVRVKFRQLGRVVARLKVVSNNAGIRNAKKVVRVRR